MNNDKKTTTAAAVASGVQILQMVLPMVGVVVPAEVFQGISAIAIFVWGFFTNRKEQ